MPRVIHWGLVVMGALSRLKLWRMMMICDEDNDSGSDGGPPGTVDEDGKGVPLYGRESKIIVGNM